MGIDWPLLFLGIGTGAVCLWMVYEVIVVDAQEPDGETDEQH